MQTEETLASRAVTEAETVVPIIEETAHIEKRAKETGVVRVRTLTQEREERIETPLIKKSAAIERISINRPVAGDPPQAREEGGVHIIPVLEEVLVVEKRLMLKEEIHIRLIETTQTETQTVTLRRNEAVIERDEPKTSFDPQ